MSRLMLHDRHHTIIGENQTFSFDLCYENIKMQ